MGLEHPFLATLVVAGLIAGGTRAQEKERTTAIAVGDLNGDKRPDVVFANLGQANQVFLNEGNCRFRDLVPDALARTRGDTTCAVLSDVDGDGDLDIVFGNRTATMRLILNDGKAGFTDASTRLPRLQDLYAHDLGAGDLDKDGDVDLVVASFGGPNVLLVNDGKGGFTRVVGPSWPQEAARTHCLVIGDVDLDGDLDVLFGNQKDPKGHGGDNTLLLNDGKENFSRGLLPRDRTSTSFLRLADMDGDGFPEILQGILSKRGGRTRQLKNRGGTSFLNRTHSRMPRDLLHVSNAVVADLDADKDLDMVVRIRDAPYRFWKNDGSGKLRGSTDGELPGGIHATTALAAVDVDGDGDLDLICANDGEANLLLRNEGGGRFAPDAEQTSFLSKVEAEEHARLRAVERKYGFRLVKQAEVGDGRYCFRLGGRKTLDKATAEAIRMGLTWLAKHQEKDGSWDCDGFAKHDPSDQRCDGRGRRGYDLPITALALLPFLADGNTPFTGKDRELVRKGVDWIRQLQVAGGRIKDRGYLLKDYIYGHCMATIVLCESFGLTGEPGLRKAAQSAINYLAEHHTPKGGWGYDKGLSYCDTSVTAWAVQAYRTAQDFGLKIETENLKEAQRWIHNRTDERGRCGYVHQGELSSRHPGAHAEQFPQELCETLTAAAVLSRYFMGEKPETSSGLERGIKLVLKKPPKWGGPCTDYYYWYYGSHALHQRGGQQEQTWRKAVLAALLPNQRRDGSFAGSFDPTSVWGPDGGRIYSTAMALLCLQAPYRYGRVTKASGESADK